MEAKNLGEAKTTKEDTQEPIIRKILIAIDESEYRRKIIMYGLTLAKSSEADITAIHVIDRPSLAALSDLSGLIGYYEGGNITNLEQELRKHGKELLDEIDEMAKKEGIKINTEVIMNAPSVAEGIINCATTRNMDIIVIGTRGMSSKQKFLMGSVADKVTSHAPCTVMAVR